MSTYQRMGLATMLFVLASPLFGGGGFAPAIAWCVFVIGGMLFIFGGDYPKRRP